LRLGAHSCSRHRSRLHQGTWSEAWECLRRQGLILTIITAADAAIIYAGLGELVAKRSGVLNLGVEG